MPDRCEPLRVQGAPQRVLRSAAEHRSAAKHCRAPHGYMDTCGYLQMCSIADTAIHGYQGIAHTTELRILAQVQYCGYRILYCGYRIHTHPRAVHVHAYSRTQHTTASPHLTHSSSSTPNLLGCTAKSALPRPFTLTNIGHACPSRLIAETYTSHGHSQVTA